jgi:serine phosphatase RsbU (regulator of sigma subunit)
LLGALDTAQYEIGRTTMETGDLLAITTDGITEARRARTSSFFGLDGLVGAVRDTWNHESLAGIGQAVAERAQQFGGGALKDDVCLLLARRREPENGA